MARCKKNLFIPDIGIKDTNKWALLKGEVNSSSLTSSRNNSNEDAVNHFPLSISYMNIVPEIQSSWKARFPFTDLLVVANAIQVSIDFYLRN